VGNLNLNFLSADGGEDTDSVEATCLIIAMQRSDVNQGARLACIVSIQRHDQVPADGIWWQGLGKPRATATQDDGNNHDMTPRA
jgi:hypothetical protein